jgi:hypothetical protein
MRRLRGAPSGGDPGRTASRWAERMWSNRRVVVYEGHQWSPAELEQLEEGDVPRCGDTDVRFRSYAHATRRASLSGHRGACDFDEPR